MGVICLAGCEINIATICLTCMQCVHHRGENNNLIILITLKHNYRAVCTCTCVLHLIPL